MLALYPSISLSVLYSFLAMIIEFCFQCLLVVLTLEWSGGPHLGSAAWIIALRENDHLPYLLHTYHTPHTTRHVHMYTACVATPFTNIPFSLFCSNLILCSHTGLNKLWTLVGVADRKQLLVWRGTETDLPSMTVSLEGTFQHRLFESCTTC